jgi:regulator of protease activity HflC (stomatin/prohibitin superfamily)
MDRNIQIPGLPENLGGHFGRSVLFGAGGLLCLVTIFSSYYTIDQGARGVILRNGAIVDTAEPGLHFKLPLIDKVATISVQQQTQRYPKVQAYSRDQQPADLVISVTFRITDPEQVYSQYGNIDNLMARLIDPRVLEQVKNVFGQFDAASAIQDRSKLNAEVSNAVRAAIKGPMVIESLQIENIDFSDIYEQAVEDRMQATVLQQKALAQKARRLTEADAAAYEVKAAADAQAHAIEIKGAAEASAIKARGDALRQNPGIPALVTAEKWDGHLPTTMPPNGAVPFLNVQH